MKPKKKNTKKFDIENIDIQQVEMLASAGWSLLEVSNFFGVNRTRFNNWVLSNKNGLGDAFNSGSNQSIKRVERALFEKAIGYKHKDTKFMTKSLGHNQGSEIVKLKYTKHYPPDTQAIIFYLTNKEREKWKHRFEIQTETENKKLPDMSNLKFNDLKELAFGNGVPLKKIKEARKNKKKLVDKVKKTDKKSKK